MRVLVVGGGIAGVETALTLQEGLKDAEVSLLTSTTRLNILPNLVYVPFGASFDSLSFSVSPAIKNIILDTAVRVDMEGQKVYGSSGKGYEYDYLVLAMGTRAAPAQGLRLRTLNDAQSLRNSLLHLPTDQKTDIALRIYPETSWAAPAYEFALLLSTWLHEIKRDNKADIFITTDDMSALDVFNPKVSKLVQAKLDEAGVEFIANIPGGRMDMLSAHLNIDFGAIMANHLPGSPSLSPAGFYKTDHNGSISPNVFAAGDGANIPIKAAFTTSWQARRILHALGGELEGDVDGVPQDSCEYQMDLGTSTMCVRLEAGAYLTGYYLGSEMEVTITHEPPDKLKGTMIREKLINHQTSHAYRQSLKLSRLDKLYENILGH